MKILPPMPSERLLHNKASFQPGYMARALRRAVQDKAGLAFMPCHPSEGWQGMSPTDIAAERDVPAYPTAATGPVYTSMVMTELDGALDDPSYISTFPKRERVANQKVFPFSLSFAAMEINMMVHYLLALDW